MPITTRIDTDLNITVHEAEGELTYEDILQTMGSFYGDPELPENVLWDGRRATLKGLTRQELESIAIHPRQFLLRNRIKAGKRAILVGSEVDYGLSRVINIVKDVAGEDLPYEISVFRSLADAVQWLTHVGVENE